MFRFARKIKTLLQMCHHICLFCKWKHQCRMERNYVQLTMFKKAAQLNYHGVDEDDFIYADTDSIH